MAYQKKNLTPEQRAEIGRKANAARKNRRGGRPKLAPGQSKAKAIHTIGVYEEDYKVFKRLAQVIGKTLGETMHEIAKARVNANPDLFNDAPLSL